uniref:Uncharacterized protein n=1 Tax=Anguilla anguilla TaxID=7936 RepID=A0A0E9QBY5_ANGAN
MSLVPGKYCHATRDAHAYTGNNVSTTMQGKEITYYDF